MPWRRILLSLAATLLVPHLFQSPLTAAEAADLVRQLGSDSYRLREVASKKLLSLKTAALPALQGGLQYEDPEVRDRCRNIISAITLRPEEVRLRGFVAGKIKSLPGWQEFSEEVGSSRDARSLFAAIYRVDRGVLGELQRDPKRAKQVAKDRASRLSREISKLDPQQTLGRAAALAYAAAKASSLDYQTFSGVSRTLGRTEVAQLLGNNRVVRKMVEKVVQGQTDSRNFYQQISLAQRYDLRDYAEKTLAPTLKKQLSAALKKTSQSNLSTIQRLAYQAKQAGLEQLLEEDIKPAIQKWAEKATKKPDISQLYSLVGLSRTLDLNATLEDCVRPAFVKWLQTSRNPLPENGRAYQLINVARTLDLENATRAILTPFIEDRMLVVSMNPDRNRISRLLNDLQNLGMQKSADAFLKPAAEQLLRNVVERGGSVTDVQQIVYLTQRLNLADVVEKTLKPYIRDKAVKLGMKNVDLNNAYRVFNIARQLGMQKTIDEIIRPGVDRAFKALEDRPINSSAVYQALTLAEQLQSKAAVKYTLRAAHTNRVSNYVRARAIYTVGKLGGEEEIEELSKLLKDNVSIGTRRINQLSVSTRLSDVALAAMIHLSGQSLQDYGFDYAVQQKRGFLNVSYYYLGFSNDSKRQEARRKWKAWVAKNRS